MIESQSLKVISASRRVEMVAFFPQRLMEALEKRCPPSGVHSIVLWSKDPRNLLSHAPLRDSLRRYDQVFLHFTISGMGDSFLEPRIPSTRESLLFLSELVAFLGRPSRLRVRFDPIVHLRLPDGETYTNLDRFVEVATAAKGVGAHDVTISWMAAYPKVVRRLRKHGIEPVPISEEAWREEARWILRQARSIGLDVLGCCVERFPVSRCIDGALLTRLHPKQAVASQKKAKGQRPGCGCTESWDIGWYYPCPGGCLYCYGQPVAYPRLKGKNPRLN